MFEKHIRVLENSDWEYTEYSDEALLSLINQYAQEIPRFEMLELCLFDYENGDISVMVTVKGSGTTRFGSFKTIDVHKVNDMDEQKELDAFQKEAYRLKRMLKCKYPKIQVTSNFNWQGMH